MTTVEKKWKQIQNLKLNKKSIPIKWKLSYKDLDVPLMEAHLLTSFSAEVCPHERKYGYETRHALAHP